jgi:hypothetical protein
VPLATYEDFAPAIARMAAGEYGVLTSARVKLFEPSSGSTSAAKLIPYTAALQREFQAGLAAWIGNLYGQMPALMGGPAYWSLTPLTSGRPCTPAGIPIGFEEDSAYLGMVGRLVEAALAVPNVVKHVSEMEAFRYVTLRYLLATSDLRLISVWNPTFLTLLLDALVAWWEPLLEDMAAGTLTLHKGVDGDLLQKLTRNLRPDPVRARFLRPLDPRDPATVAKIWPRLALVSCWADGPSARFAAELRARLPAVTMQPKGLLATEAMVSLPWIGTEGALLALTSHFLEFVDQAGEVHLAHELRHGALYSVVVTTGGGLYRYQLHDQVEVVGRVAATPCIRFVGKTDRVADWFGEKLNEQFVARCLETLWAWRAISPRFALVAPAEVEGTFAYTLYIEADELGDEDELVRQHQTRAAGSLIGVGGGIFARRGAEENPTLALPRLGREQSRDDKNILSVMPKASLPSAALREALLCSDEARAGEGGRLDGGGVKVIGGQDELANGKQFILPLRRECPQQQCGQMVGQPLGDKVAWHIKPLARPQDHVGREAGAVEGSKERDRLLVEGAAVDRGQHRATQVRFHGHHRFTRIAIGRGFT